MDGVVTTDLRMVEVHVDDEQVRLEVEGRAVTLGPGAAEQLEVALRAARRRASCRDVPVPR